MVDMESLQGPVILQGSKIRCFLWCLMSISHSVLIISSQSLLDATGCFSSVHVIFLEGFIKRWSCCSVKLHKKRFKTQQKTIRPGLWVQRYVITLLLIRPFNTTQDELDPSDLCAYIRLRYSDYAVGGTAGGSNRSPDRSRFITAVPDHSTGSHYTTELPSKFCLWSIKQHFVFSVNVWSVCWLGLHRVPGVIRWRSLTVGEVLCIWGGFMCRRPWQPRPCCWNELKLSWDWSGLKVVCGGRGGITAKFMTQILILVQEGWSRAVKKTLERYFVSMSVCVHVCVLGGGFVNCLPTL